MLPTILKMFSLNFQKMCELLTEGQTFWQMSSLWWKTPNWWRLERFTTRQEVTGVDTPTKLQLSSKEQI